MVSSLDARPLRYASAPSCFEEMRSVGEIIRADKVARLYRSTWPAMLISRFDDSRSKRRHDENPRSSDFHARQPSISCSAHSKHLLPGSGITGTREELVCGGTATSIWVSESMTGRQRAAGSRSRIIGVRNISRFWVRLAPASPHCSASS